MDRENTTALKHQFIMHHYHANGIIRCCIYCDLSHILPSILEQQWELIRETEKDTSFSEACPAEIGSDALPYHHFILSYSGIPRFGEIIVRFCTHCGLSHRLTKDDYKPGQGRPLQNHYHWQRIRENTKDMTLLGPCAGESEMQNLQKRHKGILGQ